MTSSSFAFLPLGTSVSDAETTDGPPRKKQHIELERHSMAPCSFQKPPLDIVASPTQTITNVCPTKTMAGGGKYTYRKIIPAARTSTISVSIGPQGRDWSALPVDILLMVLGRLQSKDCVRCRAVCVSWRHVFTAKLVSSAPELPWLMFYQIGCFNRIAWHKFNNNEEECRIRLPKHESFIGFTSDGYMVFSGETSELLVINPLTGSQIHFPSTTALPKTRSISISKVALLNRPTSAAVLVVAYNHGSGTQLAFSRVGDCMWTLLGGSEGEAEAILFHNELLYVVTRHHGTVSWNLLAEHPPQRMTLPPIGKELLHARRRFPVAVCLVESTGGDLLQVRSSRYGEYAVFMLDTATSKWCIVTRLCGDDALMLSPCGAVCVSSRDGPGLRGNSIYSTLELRDFSMDTGCKKRTPEKYSPMHVYSLSDETVTHTPLPGGEFLIGPRPNWFIPRFS